MGKFRGRCGRSVNELLAAEGYVFRCVKSHERVVLLYLASVVGSWVANLILLGILYQWAGVNIAYAQLMTTSLVCLMNFQVQRRVFS